jgi:hypothetical protein
MDPIGVLNAMMAYGLKDRAIADRKSFNHQVAAGAATLRALNAVMGQAAQPRVITAAQLLLIALGGGVPIIEFNDKKKFGMTLGISFGNGLKLGLKPLDGHAQQIIFGLSKVMKLRPIHEPDIKIFIATDIANFEDKNKKSSDTDVYFKYKIPNISFWTLLPHENKNDLICALSPRLTESAQPLQFMCISYLIALLLQNCGGLLLHGALVQKDNYGLILAGRQGIGKTTASNRLQLPWLCVSDDMTLVIRDNKGMYWAHPWPTWSRFFNKGYISWLIPQMIRYCP